MHALRSEGRRGKARGSEWADVRRHVGIECTLRARSGNLAEWRQSTCHRKDTTRARPAMYACARVVDVHVRIQRGVRAVRGHVQQ
jgi:hypothetical protein